MFLKYLKLLAENMTQVSFPINSECEYKIPRLNMKKGFSIVPSVDLCEWLKMLCNRLILSPR